MKVKACWIFAIALTLMSQCALAGSQLGGSLGNWLDREAIPDFKKLVSNHPRFTGQVVEITGMADGRSVPLPSILADQIREDLTMALVNSTNVKIRAAGGDACELSKADVVLGIEIEKRSRGHHSVTLAMLDPYENVWINSTVQSWSGQLDRTQQRASDSALVAASDTFSRSDNTGIAAALVKQVICQPTLPAPLYVTGDDAYQDVVQAIRQQLDSTSLVTLSMDEAKTVLALRAVEPGKLVLSIGGSATSPSQLAAVSVVGEGSAPDTTLLSDIEIQYRSRQCKRDEVCVELTYELYEPAYLQTVITRDGNLVPLSCDSTPVRENGKQTITLRIPTGSATRPALGFYVLAVKDRQRAKLLQRAFKSGSERCGHGQFSADELSPLLAGGEISWRATHFRRQGQSVSTF